MNFIADLQLDSFHDNRTDAYSDAYEYLMGIYASNARKNGPIHFKFVWIAARKRYSYQFLPPWTYRAYLQS